MQNLYSAISVSSMALYNNCNFKRRLTYGLLKFCEKTAEFTMLLIYNVACVHAKPGESQSLPFSGLFAKFCTCGYCGSKRETGIAENIANRSWFGGNVDFYMQFGPSFYDERKGRSDKMFIST